MSAIDLKTFDFPEIARRFFAREIDMNAEAAQVERDVYISHINELSERLASNIEGLGERQLEWRISGKPSNWDASGDEAEFNISEIATHVASGTTFYHFNIARALGHPRPRFLRPDRDKRVTGQSGSVLGRGGWGGVSGEDLARMLRTTTRDFLTYVGGLSEEDEISLGDVEGYGSLTPRAWLLLDTVHFEMHLKQLEQMLAHPDFPAGD